jgi:hypothetical protein
VGTPFPYTLKPLRKEDQACLIMNFWETEIGHDIASNKLVCIELYVKEIPDLFSESIRDTNAAGEFAGVPLQTILLAEYFCDTVKAFSTSEIISLPPLPSRLNVLHLYTHFVQKKYNIYCEEKKCQDMMNVANIVDDIVLSEHFMYHHETFALSTLFGEKLVNSLLIRKCKKGATAVNEIAEGKERAGLIVDVVNQIPIFSHRKFDEYFVAGWYAKNMDDLETKKFSRKVLFRQGNGIWRNISDRILSKENCELHNEVLNGDKTKICELLLGAEVDIKAVDVGGKTYWCSITYQKP